MKKILSLCSLLAITLALTACANKQTETKVTSETEILNTLDEINLADYYTINDKGIVEDIEELDKLKMDLFIALANQPRSQEEYSLLKSKLFLYGDSITYQDNAFELIKELQEMIQVSPTYIIDFDDDLATDIYELLILDTSPLAPSSKINGRQDGKVTEEVSVYVLNDGSNYFISDVTTSQFITKAIQNNKIVQDNYVKVNIEMYADEMKSLLVLANSSSSVSNASGFNIHPIAVTVTGASSSQSFAGNITFYHNGNESVQNSQVFWIDTTKGVQDTVSYLERSKTYTKILDKVHMNRTYVLAYID